MHRVTLFVVVCLLLSACSAGSTESSSAAATTSTSAVTTTSRAPSTTPATSTSAATATTTATASTSHPGLPPITGQVIVARWEDEGIHQQYYAADQPTGYFAGPRFPLAWSGDNVSHWLGFAETSGAGSERGPYDSPFLGLVMLLSDATSAGYEEHFRVVSTEPVEIPAGGGMMAALCPNEDGVPRYAAMLQFTPAGLTTVHAWDPDLEAGELAPIDAPPEGCRATLEGTIVTQFGGWHAVEDTNRGRMLSINSGYPEPVSWWDFGGGYVGMPNTSVLLVRDDHDPTSATARQAWLAESLGWDYAGFPLWLILAGQELPPLSTDSGVSGLCWVAATNIPAVALIDDPCTEASPSRAWIVDIARLEFVETDSATVDCPCEGD